MNLPAYGAWNVKRVAAGTGEALPGPAMLRCFAGAIVSYNRYAPGSGCGAGWASEAAVLPIEPSGTTEPAGEGRAAASFMRHARGRAGECHIVARTTKQETVRELQRTLYRAAKADPGRRFHALHDKVYRSDVLERAWELVRANRGVAGIDKPSIADVEQYGVSPLLDELTADLKDGCWRPLPARRVLIPKPGRPRSSVRCRSRRSVIVSCRRR